jgi:hypothetical protein
LRRSFSFGMLASPIAIFGAPATLNTPALRHIPRNKPVGPREGFMADQATRPANCAACAFWRKLRENEGVCARHAPQTSIRPEEAAHWPQTRGWQWCGEGVDAKALSIETHCADCLYWQHPQGGLHPVNRGDMPMAWWAHAGICARHAPHPVSEPGPRAFWRATHNTDLCAEGLPRSPGERSPVVHP